MDGQQQDQNAQDQQITIDDKYINESITKALELNNKALEDRFNKLKEENENLKAEKRKYEIMKELEENNLPNSCMNLLSIYDESEILSQKIQVLNDLVKEITKKVRDEVIESGRYAPPHNTDTKVSIQSAFEKAVRG